MKFIEASMIFPLTCLIVLALIGLTMQFYDHLTVQIAQHDEKRAALYQPAEIQVIRLYDRLQQERQQEPAV